MIPETGKKLIRIGACAALAALLLIVSAAAAGVSPLQRPAGLRSAGEPSLRFDTGDGATLAAVVTGNPGSDCALFVSRTLGPYALTREFGVFAIPGVTGEHLVLTNVIGADGSLRVELPVDALSEEGVFAQALVTPRGGSVATWALTNTAAARRDDGAIVAAVPVRLALRRRAWVLVALALLVGGVLVAVTRAGRPDVLVARSIARFAVALVAVTAAVGLRVAFQQHRIPPLEVVFGTRNAQIADAFDARMPELVARCRAAQKRGEAVLVHAEDAAGIRIRCALPILVPGLRVIAVDTTTDDSRSTLVVWCAAALRGASGPGLERSGAIAWRERRP